MQDEFEDRLKRLTPRSTTVDSQAAAFAAGARSVRVWRSAAAVLLVAAVVLWLVRPGQVSSVPANSVAVTHPTSPVVQPNLSSLKAEARLWDDLLDRGLDALPSVPPVRSLTID